jgi:hypothetical protein
MSNTLSIDLLQSKGACARECIALREIYPDGTIIFDMSFYPQVRDKPINVMWAVLLLPSNIQLQLALGWFDRALAGQAVPWKSDLRTLVIAPQGTAAAAQLGARLADRRLVSAADELATAVAGVGYAAAALAGKFAETPIDPLRTQSAMAVMAGWCSRCAAVVETKADTVVLDDLKSAVWQALSQHGATLPTMR